MEKTKDVLDKLERAKMYILGSGFDNETRVHGIGLLMELVEQGDDEALFLTGKLVLEGIINLKEGFDREETGMNFLFESASMGNMNAKLMLNQICYYRYQKNIPLNTKNVNEGPLVDFEGKQIIINRTGIRTPVDAVLTYKDGMNYLHLSLNPIFIHLEDSVEDEKKFEKSVLDGFRQWAGMYEVFGGQKLAVEIEITDKNNAYDNVYIFSISDDTVDIASKLSSKKGKNLLDNSEGFAFTGARKWSVTSRKAIYIRNRDVRLNDYDEIQDIAKHEFGHVLGLGDLYAYDSLDLNGIDKGRYSEIDAYHVSGKTYNLVMCNHHGVISNNDVEMVVLSFSENKIQEYQKNGKFKEISKALGNGN